MLCAFCSSIFAALSVVTATLDSIFDRSENEPVTTTSSIPS